MIKQQWKWIFHEMRNLCNFNARTALGRLSPQKGNFLLISTSGGGFVHKRRSISIRSKSYACLVMQRATSECKASDKHHNRKTTQKLNPELNEAFEFVVMVEICLRVGNKEYMHDCRMISSLLPQCTWVSRSGVNFVLRTHQGHVHEWCCNISLDAGKKKIKHVL